jgi:hypothetical protein
VASAKSKVSVGSVVCDNREQAAILLERMLALEEPRAETAPRGGARHHSYHGTGRASTWQPDKRILPGGARMPRRSQV